MTTAIRKHIGDFAAILAMSVVAIGVGAYILFNQDARPNIPLIEDKPVNMEAEFSDAQAVVPGQGQSVRVAGVQVGKIGKVELENGLAVVTMAIDQRYAKLVHQDASALLRPRTGLKDMFVELDPGSTSTPPLGENGRIPVQNTSPDIDPDEILSALDADTRSYLKLLVSGLGKGLKNNGQNLREVFERLEPLHRDLAKVQGAFASRREALARLIHNYGELTTELGKNDQDLTRLVTSSDEVFQALASQDQNISESVRRLPSALNQTSDTLAKVDRLGGVLGPTLDQLRPAFRQLDVANREVLPLAREGEPILRTEVRPFVRTARPYVRDLRPTATTLARATPDLTTSFGELNRFFNMLAFNPDGYAQNNAANPRVGQEPPNDRNRDEGYLFWLDWVANNGVSVHSTSDAGGPIRRATFSIGCASLQQLLAGPGAGEVIGLLPTFPPAAQTALIGLIGSVGGCAAGDVLNPKTFDKQDGASGPPSKRAAAGGRRDQGSPGAPDAPAPPDSSKIQSLLEGATGQGSPDAQAGEAPSGAQAAPPDGQANKAPPSSDGGQGGGN